MIALFAGAQIGYLIKSIHLQSKWYLQSTHACQAILCNNQLTQASCKPEQKKNYRFYNRFNRVRPRNANNCKVRCTDCTGFHKTNIIIIEIKRIRKKEKRFIGTGSISNANINIRV